MADKRRRQCKTCKVVFASPAAWVKHRGEGGMCRPVTVFPLYNLQCTQAGVWHIKIPKKASR